MIDEVIEKSKQLRLKACSQNIAQVIEMATEKNWSVLEAVAYLFDHAGDYYVGGALEGIQLPTHYDFQDLRRTPKQVRGMFEQLGDQGALARAALADTMNLDGVDGEQRRLGDGAGEGHARVVGAIGGWREGQALSPRQVQRTVGRGQRDLDRVAAGVEIANRQCGAGRGREQQHAVLVDGLRARHAVLRRVVGSGLVEVVQVDRDRGGVVGTLVVDGGNRQRETWGGLEIEYTAVGYGDLTSGRIDRKGTVGIASGDCVFEWTKLWICGDDTADHGAVGTVLVQARGEAGDRQIHSAGHDYIRAVRKRSDLRSNDAGSESSPDHFCG